MSQETTQDLTQPKIEDSTQEHQDDHENGSESIAMLEYEDPTTGEMLEIALYAEVEIRIGRESHIQSPTSTSRKTVKNYEIHDGRVSKSHFRIYSIIYELKKVYDTETESLPPLVYCEDLESSNGTYINGNLIGIMGKEKVAHLLCDGDVIEIRPSWKFRYHQSNHQMIFPTSAQSKDMEYFRDRYNVSDRILGSGKFGSVYLAFEQSTKKQVACKVVDLESAISSVSKNRPDPSAPGLRWKSDLVSAKKQRKKVLLEIEILSKLTHPNIINLKKAFCSNHALYIFTDLAPAGDLFSYAQSHGGHLDDYNTRVITKQIALALDYLHAQGIAHRDIKQENVLITTTDFGGRVLLTDFGFATYANARNGRMLSKVGTEGFVAPEVENVERMSVGYTKSADMWSLGAMTASLLTGGMEIPCEELPQLSQVEIADRFLGVDDSYTRQQWFNMPPRALKFIQNLLVLDPEERMTATEAVKHSWYTKPPREAEALEHGLQRINRFWRPREIPSDEILEGLPGVVLSAPLAADAPGPKFRRKIPDATSSPYFGLDRHLTQKVPSGRKRLLDDLNESGSPFVTYQVPQQRKPVANTGAQRNKGLSRLPSVEGTDIFGMSLLKSDSPEAQADPDIIDLTSKTFESGSNTEGDDFTPTTRCVEKQFGFSLSSPSRPTSSSGASRNDSPESRSHSGGKRWKKASGEARTSGVSSKDSPRYTSGETLRNKVSRMKL